MKISIIQNKIIKQICIDESTSIVHDISIFENGYETYIIDNKGIKDHNYPFLNIFLDFSGNEYIVYVTFFNDNQFKNKKIDSITDKNKILDYIEKFYKNYKKGDLL